MALITWNDGLSVGVAEIDGQHKELVNMINQLHDALKSGKARDSAEPIIEKMAGYAEKHFATEERYFKQYAYPETGTHMEEHSKFIDKVTEFQTKLKASQVTLTIEVVRYLNDWLINHIQKVDKKYGPFLNEKGLK